MIEWLIVGGVVTAGWIKSICSDDDPYPAPADDYWRNQKPTTASYWDGGGMLTYDTRTGETLYYH